MLYNRLTHRCQNSGGCLGKKEVSKSAERVSSEGVVGAGMDVVAQDEGTRLGAEDRTATGVERAKRLCDRDALENADEFRPSPPTPPIPTTPNEPLDEPPRNEESLTISAVCTSASSAKGSPDGGRAV